MGSWRIDFVIRAPRGKPRNSKRRTFVSFVSVYSNFFKGSACVQVVIRSKIARFVYIKSQLACFLPDIALSSFS
jgi:hypothetical protein